MSYESGKYYVELTHVKREESSRNISIFQATSAQRGLNVKAAVLSNEINPRLYQVPTGVDAGFLFVTRPSSSPVTRAVAERRVRDVYKEGLTVTGLVHAKVVALRLNGHEQDLLFEMVWSDVSNEKFNLSIRYRQGMTTLYPGVKADVLVWHSNESSFVDGKTTTVSRILFPGAIPLSFAWPRFATQGANNRLNPPPSRRFIAQAMDRYMRKCSRPAEADETDIPRQICNWMFSSNKVKRNKVWGDYNNIVSRPHTSGLNRWLKIYS